MNYDSYGVNYIKLRVCNVKYYFRETYSKLTH